MTRSIASGRYHVIGRNNPKAGTATGALYNAPEGSIILGDPAALNEKAEPTSEPPQPQPQPSA